jgi:hypothetical protein
MIPCYQAESNPHPARHPFQLRLAADGRHRLIAAGL